ncbi:hypothetical protein BGW36DRAFT_191930 [Talaromyces proteolyticus]|uniref:Zn(2)-C6 fungal-type domain-containing protein n=1 Tax=Talaromyces proteolyticus TaxID=1131652 RepID=A0AAD4KMF4_9EURO|nr:uncharacterized protein BGW36DRAFT_191930 [Talaromyces proteolyticus]KAH8694854.1 hypothetical protein BGW36DRAFT_191930 [Talaromyces proteolyticus]
MTKRACDCCNIRKIRCNGTQPCHRCLVNDLNCTYLRQLRKTGPRNLRASSIQKIWRGQMSLTEAAVVKEAHHSWSIYSPEMMIAPVLPEKRIPIPVIQVALEMYQDKLYGIWPMLSAEDLIHTLKTDPNDVQTYTLSIALSAATLSHLGKSLSINDSPQEKVTADSFAREVRRVRGTFDYMEPVTLQSVLTSYFLHTYYGKQPSRSQTAAFYIREAISFAQLLGMHTEAAYTRHSLDDQKIMRKLYFLLFMTERYLCIQDGLPTVLEPINLPTLEGEQLPHVLSGFLNLVNLFNTPGTEFFSKWTSQVSNGLSVSSRQLLLLQRELQLPTEIPTEATDIQKIDIFATRHWIRSLAWKLCVQQGYITTEARKEMNLLYPHQIAQDALSEIAHISPYAFEVHGPGMDVKMTEVAMVLADAILCLPGEENIGRSSFVVKPRETLKMLCDMIFLTKPILPDLRESLCQKLEIALGGSSICPSIEVLDDHDFLQIIGASDTLSDGIINSAQGEILEARSFPSLTLPMFDGRVSDKVLGFSAHMDITVEDADSPVELV